MIKIVNNISIKRMFTTNFELILADLITCLYNNGLPFLSGVLILRTSNIAFIFLLVIPSLFPLSSFVKDDDK